MVGEKDRVDGYLGSVDRLEPELHCVDRDAALTSIAISLKRIADMMELDDARKARAEGAVG